MGDREPEELDDDVEEVEDDPDAVEADLAIAAEDEEDAEEASLEELLTQRTAGRRGADDPDDDDDIMALATEREPKVTEPLPSRVIPIKDRQEFVCTNCHLVKKRSQLADEARVLCRDCV